MLKRTLLFTSPVYLSLKNEQLVVCFKDTPDDKRTIPIEDIGFILIDNPMVSSQCHLLMHWPIIMLL